MGSEEYETAVSKNSEILWGGQVLLDLSHSLFLAFRGLAHGFRWFSSSFESFWKPLRGLFRLLFMVFKVI